MVDENGANLCAITQAFGVNFMTSKVVSCQMHYKSDVNRVSFRIWLSYRDIFKSICCKMCSIATVVQYSKLKQWLDKVANLFPNISQWLAWWDAMRYHMFPAFKCFGYSTIILAKSGNAMLKHQTQLWLLEAAQDDTYSMLTYII